MSLERIVHQKAYLTAPCREKDFTVAGDEFGSDSGKTLIITSALHGLKLADASFWAFLGEHLYDMGYRPCRINSATETDQRIKQ